MHKHSRAEWNTREWRELRAKVFKRDHWRCWRCHARLPQEYLTCHHRQPRAEGGSNDPTNLATLCSPCHDLVEIYNLRTKADIVGSMPDPPPLPREWIKQLGRDNDPDESSIARVLGMTLYGIIHEDKDHCLKCGRASDSLSRYNFVFDKSGYKVHGWAILCRGCLAEVKQQQPANVAEIIGQYNAGTIGKDSSPYLEVVDHEYWELFMRPAWQGGKLAGY